MLKNNFYFIELKTQQEDNIAATISLNPEHEIFKGHFPGKPVVPGVCMIQIVKELLEEHSGEPLLFTKGNQIKFLQLLIPQKDELIDVNIQWKTIDEGLQTTADFKKEGNVILKLNGIFNKQ